MAKKGGAFIKLEGFDDLIKQIQEAGGKVDKLVYDCVEQSANVMDANLREEMLKPRVIQMYEGMEKHDFNDLVKRMPKPEVYKTKHSVGGRVGYIPTQYHPKNIDDYYKVIFINYGTPRIKPREFIKKAKSKGSRKIKKMQKETFNKILEDLKK